MAISGGCHMNSLKNIRTVGLTEVYTLGTAAEILEQVLL